MVGPGWSIWSRHQPLAFPSKVHGDDCGIWCSLKSPLFFLSLATFTSDHLSEPSQGALSLVTNFHVCDVGSHIPGYGVADRDG